MKPRDNITEANFAREDFLQACHDESMLPGEVGVSGN